MIAFLLSGALLLPLVAPNCLTDTHPLEAFRVTNSDQAKRVWWDRFGTADGDFSCYEADLQKLTSSWTILGHLPQPNHFPLQSFVYAFRACADADRLPALVKPVGFTRIWDDAGSTHIQDGSLWRASCQQGYSRLSDFFYPENEVPEPSGLFSKVRCVRDDLVEDCGVGLRVWKYKGLIISDSVSVWQTSPAKSALATPFLYGNQLINSAPGIQFRCLKKTSYVIV